MALFEIKTDFSKKEQGSIDIYHVVREIKLFGKWTIFKQNKFLPTVVQEYKDKKNSWLLKHKIGKVLKGLVSYKRIQEILDKKNQRK